MTDAVSPLITVVDDDESVREALPDLLMALGFTVEAFGSAEAFLASGKLDETACLVLDIAMPGMNGLALQRELTRRQQRIPIVFITAHGDELTRPEVLARGAVACLFKPFTEAALIEALQAAIESR